MPLPTVVLPRTLAIYLGAATVFGALALRGFLLPLRASELGIDRLQIGLFTAASLFTAAILSVPAGFLADRVGRRRLLMGAIMLGGLSEIGIWLAPSALPIYLCQVLIGIMAAAAQAGLFSALADIVPAPRLGRAMGWLTLSMQVGFLVGPAAAGFGLQFTDVRGELLGATAIFALALLLSLMAGRDGPPKGGGFELAGPVRELAATSGFSAVVVGVVAAAVLWGTLQAYLPLFAKESLRLPGPQIGYLIAFIAVVNGISRVPAGLVVDRARRRGPIVIVGVLAVAAALAVLPHLRGFWAPALILGAAVPFNAATFIAVSVTFSALATPATRGIAMGIYGTFLFLGLGAGPALLGGLFERGYVQGFTATAGVAVGLAAVTALMRVQPRRRRRGPAPIPPPAALRP